MTARARKARAGVSDEGHRRRNRGGAISGSAGVLNHFLEGRHEHRERGASAIAVRAHEAGGFADQIWELFPVAISPFWYRKTRGDLTGSAEPTPHAACEIARRHLATCEIARRHLGGACATNDGEAPARADIERASIWPLANQFQALMSVTHLLGILSRMQINSFVCIGSPLLRPNAGLTV